MSDKVDHGRHAHDNGRANICPRAALGLSRTDAQRQTEDVIGAFALGGRNDRPVDTYSSRHRRRLEVARALPVGTRSALPGRKVAHG
jgi:ABC-type Na+ transport system ATPase subunit NatA